MRPNNRLNPGFSSTILKFGLILLLLGLGVLPTYQVQAQTTTPTATPTKTSGSTPTPTVATTPVITPTVSPGPGFTPTPSPTVTQTVPLSSPVITSTAPVSTTVSPIATPTPDPAKAEKEKKEKEEKEKAEKEKAKQKALSRASYYSLSWGQPEAAAIDNWLARCNSPQLLEAAPGKTIGQTYLELGWKYGINPAYALAFFTKESSCGTAGDNLAAHNFGNIRWTAGYPTLDRVWRSYPSWNAGMEAWFQLISEQYINRGARTLRDVLPIYAPESENDTTLYMNQVMSWVDALMATSATDIDLSHTWYCQATGYRLNWDMLEYWLNHGNVITLGWPISDQLFEDGRIVQYFERGILEYSPEKPPAEQVVMRDIGRNLGQSQPSVSGDNGTDKDAVYFPETGHWLAGQFAKTWNDLGGVAQFGYPIAEVEIKGNRLIQWFERARFELNPEQTNGEVTLGLLGKEALNLRLKLVYAAP